MSCLCSSSWRVIESFGEIISSIMKGSLGGLEKHPKWALLSLLQSEHVPWPKLLGCLLWAWSSGSLSRIDPSTSARFS